MARILLIDDDGASRYLVRRPLEAAGHQVAEAPNGVDGLRLLGRQPIDLVITDLRMPQMDGFELINEVRRDFPGIPVVAYTASIATDLDYLAAARQIGAREVLHVPFSDEALLDAVGKALAA
jgi:CheY-like chemotaxis protein